MESSQSQLLNAIKNEIDLLNEKASKLNNPESSNFMENEGETAHRLPIDLPGNWSIDFDSLGDGILSKPKKEREKRNPRMINCVECGSFKNHHGKNMCANCYQRTKRLIDRLDKNKIGVCIKCNENTMIFRREMCKVCYRHAKNEADQLDDNKKRMCIVCNELKILAARSMCRNCYKRIRLQTGKLDESKHRICSQCNRSKLIHSREMCHVCYNRTLKRERKLDENKKKICGVCQQSKILEAHGMCNTCYHRLVMNPKRKARQMGREQITLNQTLEPIVNAAINSDFDNHFTSLSDFIYGDEDDTNRIQMTLESEPSTSK